MKIDKLIFVSFVLAIILTYSNVSIAENTTNIETDTYSIKSTFSKQKNKVKIKIESFEKGTKNKKYQEYLIRAREISTVAVYKNKIVLKGILKSGGDLFIILDLPSLKFVDKIWGYRASVSNDNKYLVYIKHYPRSYDSKAFSRDILMVYNLELTPQQNRVQNQEKLSPRECGLPIFPEYSKEEQQNNIYSSIVYEKKNIYKITSNIKWINDSSIIFTNFIDDYNYLVVINLDNKLIIKKHLSEKSQSKLTIKSIKQRNLHVITTYNGLEFVVDLNNEPNEKIELFYKEQ